MKILYAGYGPMGILGLINILSENAFALDSVYIFVDPEIVSDQSSLI